MNPDSGSCCSGTATAGLCSGNSDTQCCTSAPCNTPEGTGFCKQALACTSGTPVAGYCDGASDIQCCVPNVPTPDDGSNIIHVQATGGYACQLTFKVGLGQ